jgi:hypothetical protein
MILAALTRPERDALAKAETEELRLKVVALVKEAMDRGIRPSHIGYAMIDPSFVTKLLRGNRFRYTTLKRAYDILTKEREKPKDLIPSPSTQRVSVLS